MRRQRPLLFLLIVVSLACSSSSTISRPSTLSDSESSCSKFMNAVIEYGLVRLQAFCGRTTDGSGFPMPGAVVLVRSKNDTGAPLLKIVSDRDGKFCEPHLPTGEYRVLVCSGVDNGAGFNLSQYTVVISPEADKDTVELEVTLGT